MSFRACRIKAEFSRKAAKKGAAHLFFSVNLFLFKLCPSALDLRQPLPRQLKSFSSDFSEDFL